MLLAKEPPAFAYKEQPVELTKENRLAVVYASRYGQGMRSYDSTMNFVQHIKTQVARSQKTLMLPSALGLLRGFG